MKKLKEELLEIITYHSDEGTSGYLLSSEKVDQLLTLISSEKKKERERIKTYLMGHHSLKNDISNGVEVGERTAIKDLLEHLNTLDKEEHE